MSNTENIPLNFEASEGDTHKQTTTTLPTEVVSCLENARFLHLATSSDNIPHVALMNYTYIPSSPYNTRPAIIMTTNMSSRKTISIKANPAVSLLVHDWVSHRPINHNRRPSGGSPTREPPSTLASLLFNLNSTEISSISATIGGAARIARAGSDEERYFCEKHLENNTYDEGGPFAGAQGESTSSSAEGGQQRADRFVAGGDVSVIVVEIENVRISDFKGSVRDYALVPEGTAVNGSL